MQLRTKASGQCFQCGGVILGMERMEEWKENIKKQRIIKEWGIGEDMREKYLLMGEWTPTMHLH